MFRLILCGAVVVWIQGVTATSFDRSNGSRIIGGTVANAGQFPFMVAIHVQTNNSKFFCGGALTGIDYVITAGHCVYNAVLFTIRMGSIHLEGEDEGSVTVATSTYFLHPDFKPDTIENDIGIIKFRRPVNYTIYLEPVFAFQYPLVDYATVRLLGWGQTSDSVAELSNDLIHVTITTITNLECQMVYGNQITENMVCVAGNYNEGTCTGDNGGPLVVDIGKSYALVGIASFISANGCESTNPSGFTRTYPYREWIASIIYADTEGY